MTSLKPQLRLSLFLASSLALSACTDGRQVEAKKLVMKQVFSSNTPTLSLKAHVQFQKGNTSVDSMVREGNTIYMVGQPYGFSAWAIDQPDTPHPLFRH